MSVSFDLGVYLVTDRDLCLGRDLEEIVAQAVKGGCTMVQLREKHADTGEFVDLARRLLRILAPRRIPLIVNDRVDVALAAGAQGVHVGQKDMRIDDVRRLVGPDMIVGLSVENEKTAAAAKNLDVDYLGVGPIFPTSTKKDAAPVLGIDGLARIRRVSSHRLVAIGSLTVANATEAVVAGAEGVAVVSAVCSALSPESAAQELARAVCQGRR
jgi:thiamine-phosphate pyrophosphorylase